MNNKPTRNRKRKAAGRNPLLLAVSLSVPQTALNGKGDEIRSPS